MEILINMPEYIIVTVYDQYETGVQFFKNKRDLNKEVKKNIEEAKDYNQYERYICKVTGYVDYSTKKVDKIN